MAVRRRLHHADPVVGSPRRERRTLPEAVAELVRDRDRARRTGLLAHQARLAFEDAGLGLEQERDQAARALRQFALLVRILAGHRTRTNAALQRPQHPADDSPHLSTSPSTMSMEPRIATASATSRPWSSQGRICRFTNDGPRIFARNGFGLRPSLIM